MGLLVVQISPHLGPPVLDVLTRGPDAAGLAHDEVGVGEVRLLGGRAEKEEKRKDERAGRGKHLRAGKTHNHTS